MEAYQIFQFLPLHLHHHSLAQLLVRIHFFKYFKVCVKQCPVWRPKFQHGMNLHLQRQQHNKLTIHPETNQTTVVNIDQDVDETDVMTAPLQVNHRTTTTQTLIQMTMTIEALTMTKTNHPGNLTPTLTILVLPATPATSGVENQRRKRETNPLQVNPVSYTHLTLPTKA